MVRAGYALLALVVLYPCAAFPATVAELEQRIQKLEEAAAIAEEEAADVNRHLDERMVLSGYADVEYTHATATTGDAPGFRIHHLSLFLKKQIAEQWRFFSEIEYEDAPFAEFDFPSGACSNCSGKIFVEAMNFDYLPRPDLNFRFGRFYTPAGIWSIDHYPPFVPTQDRPRHIRRIFPQVFDGAMAYGTQPLGDSFLSYNLYAGNGEGNSGRHDEDSTTAAGLKLDVALPWLQQFDFGATFYHDGKVVSSNGDEKTAYGLHAKAQAGQMTLQWEYAEGNYESAAGAGYDKSGYYLQLAYDIGPWTVGYRYDVFDDNTAADALANETTTDSVFVNYHVSKDIHVKLEHHVIDEEDAAQEDYTRTIASLVVNLGN